jgi:hypothetical protein
VCSSDLAQRTETRTNTLADTVAHTGTLSSHTPAYAISSSGDWTFGDPEQVAQRERERIASLPEHRIALYKKIRPTIAALQALSYQEMQRVACKPAQSLYIKPEILALNHFVHQNEDVLPDFVDDTQPLAPSTLAFPRIENLEAFKSIALTYPKRRVVVLLMPHAEKQEKKEESVAFIQCREAAASEIAEFDKDGKLRLSRVHFQKCYESSDGKSDLIKSKQNSLPGVDFSVFGDYPLQMSITYGVGSSVPIVREVIVIVGTAYVVIKEIKDWLHYYRKIRNIQKLEKQIQQDKDRAAKNSASPEPEDPKDKDKDKKKASLPPDLDNKSKQDEKPDFNTKGLNKKQKKELDDQNRYPNQNQPAGANGKYVDAGYHHPNSCGTKSPAPKDGQAALDKSVKVAIKGNTRYQRRVGISKEQIVILDETRPGEFHGHVRTWKEIYNDPSVEDVKNALLNNCLVDKKGRVL